jgi:hypothetical protein
VFLCTMTLKIKVDLETLTPGLIEIRLPLDQIDASRSF